MQFNDTAVASLKNYTLQAPLTIAPPKALASAESVHIIHVTKGRVLARLSSCQECTLTCGDLMILDFGKGAVLSPADKAAQCQLTHLALRKSFVEHYLGPLAMIRCNSSLKPEKDYNRLRSLVSGITYLYLCDEAQNHLEILSMCLELLSEISKNFLVASDIPIAIKYRDRVRDISRFIENNYARKLTLPEVANHFFLSPQYLSRYFSRHFHKTFNAYLMEVRLSHAKQELRETPLSITEISEGNGFGNPSAFSKAFKTYFGCTPTAFREKEQVVFSPPFADFEDSPSIARKAKDPGISGIYHGNMSDIENAPKLSLAFTRLINAGHAMNFLDKDFLTQFRQAHELLHFRYVRLEHFISSAVIPTQSDSDRQLFGNAHRILDTLKEMELIPLIELGRTPPTAFFYSSDTTAGAAQPGEKNRRFIQLFEAFLKDAVRRYGQAWTGSWLFELWQPAFRHTGTKTAPDSKGKTAAQCMAAPELFSGEGGQDYARRFLYIRSLLKSHIPSAALGGPGFDISHSPGRLKDTLTALSLTGIRPDFISIYFHGTEAANGRDTLCQDPQVLHSRLKGITQEILRIYGQPVPLYATKLSFNVTENTLINDSCFYGAFMIELMLTAKKYCELTGFWLLSDITGFPTDSQDIRQTGPGLFRKNGIPKPAYYALSFLNQLGKYEIRRGPGFLLTANRPGDYRLLVYRYSDLSYEHRLLYTSMTSLHDVARLFSKELAKTADYILEHIPEGTYSIRRRHLDYINGSILDIDTQGFSHSNLDEEDYLIHAVNISSEALYYLKASCVPETRTIYVRTKESLILKVRPQSNSIYLFEIILEPSGLQL